MAKRKNKRRIHNRYLKQKKVSKLKTLSRELVKKMKKDKMVEQYLRDHDVPNMVLHTKPGAFKNKRRRDLSDRKKKHKNKQRGWQKEWE